MNRKLQIALLIAIVLLIGWGLLAFFVNPAKAPEQSAIAFDPLNATYTIDNAPITFVNGQANAGPAKFNIFGQPVVGDLNGDGADDAVLMITQDSGGSGSFFYVAAAVNTMSGAQGTNAILLGDRIAPQNIEIKDKGIIANYADRQSGEPMTARPSVGVSAYFSLDGITLKKSVSPTQVITYLISPADSTKYCNGADMDSAGYQKTITTQKSTSTPEFNPTKLQIIKATINAATTGMCRQALSQLNITENNGTVSIPPIEGWAGVSIVMCSCKPQVEVNLLQIKGITKVVWSGQ